MSKLKQYFQPTVEIVRHSPLTPLLLASAGPANPQNPLAAPGRDTKAGIMYM